MFFYLHTTKVVSDPLRVLTPRRVARRQLVVFYILFYASTNDSVDKRRRGTSRAYII